MITAVAMTIAMIATVAEVGMIMTVVEGEMIIVRTVVTRIITMVATAAEAEMIIVTTVVAMIITTLVEGEVTPAINPRQKSLWSCLISRTTLAAVIATTLREVYFSSNHSAESVYFSFEIIIILLNFKCVLH